MRRRRRIGQPFLLSPQERRAVEVALAEVFVPRIGVCVELK
jgi:hypothetical protein